MVILEATTVVRAIREADLLPEPNTRRSIPEEHCRPRKDVPIVNQPAFNWKVPERYGGMEVADVPQAEAYNLSKEWKVPIINNWMGSDTNGSRGVGYVGVAYKGCSHIATNLGPHRAQTWWV